MVILWGAKCFGCPFFVGGFFEVLCGGFFLKCFAAGGTKIGFAHLVPRLRGLTENKESAFH